MKYNARSIHGCGAAPEAFPEPAKCLYTYNARTNRLYLHILDWPYVTLRCPNLGRRVAYAQFLHDGSEVRFSENGPGEQTDPTSPPGGREESSCRRSRSSSGRRRPRQTL